MIRRRWTFLFLVLPVLITLVACQEEIDRALLGEEVAVEEEELRESDLVEPEEGALAGEDEVLEEEEMAAGDVRLEPAQLVAPGTVTAEALIGLPVTDDEGAVLAEVRDALFHFEGSLAYLILDLTQEPGVAGEEIESVALAWDVLTVEAEGTEEADVGVEVPFRLRLLGVGPLTPRLGGTTINAAVLGERAPSVALDALGTELAGDDIPTLLQVSAFVDGSVAERPLVGPEGETLGAPAGLLVDLANGKVDYLLADAGPAQDTGEPLLPIPWSEIIYTSDANNFLLAADPMLLEEAPMVERQAETMDLEEVAQFWEGSG